MKRTVSIALALLMAVSLLGACGGNEAATTAAAPDTTAAPATAAPTTEAPATEAPAESTPNPEDLRILMVNIEGSGQIEYAEGTAVPEFNGEYPMQSIYINDEKGKEFTVAAKPDEGYVFVRWAKNGETISKEDHITVVLEEDTELIAIFGEEGKNYEPVDIASLKTIGDVLNLPTPGYSIEGTTFVYAFDQEGVIYRAIAEIDEETANRIFELDFDDPDYGRKYYNILEEFPLTSVENLTENTPTQEETAKYIGKTGQELLDEGWSVWFYNLEEMQFGMNGGVYAYTVIFDGEIADPDNFDDIDYTDIAELTVKEITCDGIGDATWIEIPEGELPEE